MRKLIILTMICLFLISGCSKSDSLDEIKLEKYAYIYQTISDNDSFSNTPVFYDMDVTMSKQKDNTYRYDIIIDNPQIAMYDIQVMAIENNTEYSMSNKMMPNIGIFDDSQYNMVPYQIDAERGYMKGIAISGTTEESLINLKIRISWKDYLMVVESKEYYSITIDYNSQYAE